MQLSRKEIGHLATFAHQLIAFGVRAGIHGAKQNPEAGVDAIHTAVMEALDPIIATRFTAATITAQIRGDLEVE